MLDLTTIAALLGLTVGLGIAISLGIAAIVRRRMENEEHERQMSGLRQTSVNRYTV